MSIYSGFATRFQQQAYDQYIDQLLYVLQKRILKIYTKQSTDQQKFRQAILKLHHHLKIMEKHKYLQPKSSSALDQLVQHFCIHHPNDKSSNTQSKQGSSSRFQINSRFKNSKQKKKNKHRNSVYDTSLKKLQKISSRKRNSSGMIQRNLKNLGYQLPKHPLNKKDIHTIPVISIVQKEKEKSIINQFQSQQKVPEKQTMWIKIDQKQNESSKRPNSQAKYASTNRKKTHQNIQQRRLIRHMFDDYT